ncbi:helix-turn-helix domain-containing protein [Sphingobacterium chungjuense]|uniref:helix-turn-helix domain-containing protein n=1 Tax=Sphingobacterium chungjuense TaxID=2675553 RepID=UPI00140C5E38|nr:helix-turn-helix transcriptional regulator [Sphingobacterium chungjuense]
MAAKQYRDQQYLIQLGERIKAIRESNGWTQEHFAEICNIDIRQLGRIERAETNSTISILKMIADKLRLPLHELFKF